MYCSNLFLWLLYLVRLRTTGCLLRISSPEKRNYPPSGEPAPCGWVCARDYSGRGGSDTLVSRANLSHTEGFSALAYQLAELGMCLLCA